MKKKDIRQVIRQTELSGYKHHPFDMEKQISNYYLNGEGDSSVADILQLETYADILGPERLRAIKNSLICLIAVICRSAIAKGVDAEHSFSLSDYYINEIEQKKSVTELSEIKDSVFQEYRRLISESQNQTKSLPVAKAIRYIESHLYDHCSVSDVAKTVKRNPQYLSVLFKKELGCSPLQYIKSRKLEEACGLLKSGMSVAETADALGFCNASYFIREFKRSYGKTPTEYISFVSPLNSFS